MYSLVSVIVPVYNRPNLLREALNSIGAQTYRNFEVIIVDDGSIEQVNKIVKEFETNSEQKVIFLRQNHRGPGAARNLGLKTAHGELIAFLDSDDLWHPEMLESTVPYLQEHAKVDMVCGGWDIIDESGKARTGVFMPSGLQTKVDTDFTRTLILKSLFPIHSVLTRKNCFDRCGGFNAELLAFEDWDLWIRMAAHGCKLTFIDVPVARWRHHSGIRRSRRGQYFEQLVSKFFDNLFSNELVAEQASNLRLHAEIHLWLREAINYKRINLYRDMYRCIHKAENLFRVAIFDKEILKDYEGITACLPEAKLFRKLVRVTMPASLRRETDALQIWRQIIENKCNLSWGLVALGVFKLIFFYPDWIAKKIIGKTVRLFQELK